MVELIIYSKNRKAWYVNNKTHRINKPAFIWNDCEYWFYDGNLIDCKTKEEFDRYIKLLVFK